MHRPSTAAERIQMLGAEICARFRIIDHSATTDSELVELSGTSWAGNKVRLNRHYVQAGFRIVTGLVEPHFMAGFSGGRKAICPGLVSIDTVSRFHGYEFLSNPKATNARLDGNPCHQESLSIARLAGVDFALSVVLDQHRRLVRAFAGELEESHAAACAFSVACSCPKTSRRYDVVLTSCGGYPLDATFYQCVKGMVSCLPLVTRGGVIISAGECSEGIGSPEYQAIMHEYSGRWRDFLREIAATPLVRKDQWQLQMQSLALEHVGDANLYFATDHLSAGQVDALSTRSVAGAQENPAKAVQSLLHSLLRPGTALAVIPEGPYCAPTGG
jgi:nickel-dependent lactate racemase